MRWQLWVLGFGVWRTCLGDPKPQIRHNLFDHAPSKIVYFEDTHVVLLHDSQDRVVWRSDDEGASFQQLNTIPEGEAWNVVEHPFDSRTAFILTRTTKHYRTLDRGKSWQSFETPFRPAVIGNVLAFHSQNWDWIIYTGQECKKNPGSSSESCIEDAYVTKDAFQSPPKKLLDNTSQCMWAHASKEVDLAIPKELIYCLAFESSSDSTHTLASSRLYSSTDFFASERKFEDLGIGKSAKGLIGIGITKKYIICAMKPPSSDSDQSGSSGDMLLYVTTDSKTWHRGLFPHGHGLRENAYTVVDSTKHSIYVDILSDPSATSGTLFRSDSRGTNYVKSLEHTNRNAWGIVDFESLENIDGVALANVVDNWREVEGKKEDKKLKSMITFDDGGRWTPLKADKKDAKCDASNTASCSLHLHSVTNMRNFGRVFSSKAPGLVMGVGSIGAYLRPYEECDTFISTDAGLTWRMAAKGPHKYEFGDQGSIIVMIADDEPTDKMMYSYDYGKTWDDFDLDVHLQAMILTTIPDSTSQSFLIVGTLARKSQGDKPQRQIMAQVDFSTLKRRVCDAKKGDFEKWYARKIDGQADCLMGHKQWFTRRKQDVDCVVNEVFKDPVSQAENCPCADEDFECDFNYALDGDECVLAGPQPIPAGSCQREGDKFEGSSGYRLIPGNTCDRNRGVKKDKPVLKPCSEGKAAPGEITHNRFDFPSLVISHEYFGQSKVVLAFTNNQEVFQSSNEGFSWRQIEPSQKFLAVAMHGYDQDRAYLFTNSKTVFYTTDRGISWNKFNAPIDPNSLNIPLLDFHPTQPDWLIWTGSKDCTDPLSNKCHAEAYYSRNNGRSWTLIDTYVRICSWARDTKFKIDERIIFCEVYKEKKGSQRTADPASLQFVSGTNFFSSNKKVLFPSIVGYATFEEYMVVATLHPSTGTLTLQISMNGRDFSPGFFPPGMKLENMAYTVLESVTDAVFLHVTTHGNAGSEWGSLFKSNSNGTYYSLSLEHVNRNGRGYVDFEKMKGLDGIALMNIVSNPEDASVSGKKELQTRITHNDGGRWKPMVPPSTDSMGKSYDCSGTACALHIHGYTERSDARATFSSPTAVGLMIGVGNVGEKLAPYLDSDTFLTRDGGFSWEEVHKDAHLWEFGDQGSIIVIVNDEGPTDRVSYSLDEGLTWKDYVFSDKMRVRSITNMPSDTSRKFILLGVEAGSSDKSMAIHLDFSGTSNRKCKMDLTDPNHDDFELWSPSEEREERCLFGRQTMYYRRIRDRDCYIGEKLPVAKVVRNCMCTAEDFECEFNHRRDSSGRCVLVDGASPAPNDETCDWNQEFWYERTNVRKIPYSSCEGGEQLDKGKQHRCASYGKHGFWWWSTMVTASVLLSGLVYTWWTRRRSGAIRLNDPYSDSEGWVGTLKSLPYFVIGIAAGLWAWIQEHSPLERWLSARRSRGYRSLVVDDDAALLDDNEY